MRGIREADLHRQRHGCVRARWTSCWTSIWGIARWAWRATALRLATGSGSGFQRATLTLIPASCCSTWRAGSRNKKARSGIVEHVRNVRSTYVSPDQDLLNVVMKGHIFKLPMRFNVQPIHLK